MGDARCAENAPPAEMGVRLGTIYQSHILCLTLAPLYSRITR